MIEYKQGQNTSVLQCFTVKSMSFQIYDVKQAAEDTKRQAEDMQDRLNTTMDTYEREKNKTKELIQRAKDYLMGQCCV